MPCSIMLTEPKYRKSKPAVVSFNLNTYRESLKKSNTRNLSQYKYFKNKRKKLVGAKKIGYNFVSIKYFCMLFIIFVGLRREI